MASSAHHSARCITTSAGLPLEPRSKIACKKIARKPKKKIYNNNIYRVKIIRKNKQTNKKLINKIIRYYTFVYTLLIMTYY